MIKLYQEEKADALSQMKEEHENVLNRTIEEERSGHVSANQAAALASAEAFRAATEVANKELKEHFKDCELKHEAKINKMEEQILKYKEQEIQSKNMLHNLERKNSELMKENEKLKNEIQRLAVQVNREA